MVVQPVPIMHANKKETEEGGHLNGRMGHTVAHLLYVAIVFVSGGCGSNSHPDPSSAPPKELSSKLGPHVLVPNGAGVTTILSACPRVAKWLAPYGGLIGPAISDYKRRCP